MCLSELICRLFGRGKLRCHMGVTLYEVKKEGNIYIVCTYIHKCLGLTVYWPRCEDRTRALILFRDEGGKIYSAPVPRRTEKVAVCILYNICCVVNTARRVQIRTVLQDRWSKIVGYLFPTHFPLSAFSVRKKLAFLCSWFIAISLLAVLWKADRAD